MEKTKVTEYVIVNNESKHPKLDKVKVHNWEGDLLYSVEVYKMFGDKLKMKKLSNERAYVVAFDNFGKPKGIYMVDQSESDNTPISLKNIFTFLLLVGASSFTVVCNRVSDYLRASGEDEECVLRLSTYAYDFGLDFLGLVIICSDSYIVVGDGDYGKSSFEDDVEYVGEGLASTHILGDRLIGPVDDIKKLIKSRRKTRH